MRRSLIITVVIALLCLCGCEAAVTVPESPEPTKASELLRTSYHRPQAGIYQKGVDFFARRCDEARSVYCSG